VHARLICSVGLLLATGAAHSLETPDLRWLAGAWCHDEPGRSIEEHWLPERGGLMLGVNRTITPRGPSFEFLRIEVKPDAVRFIAQPGGGPPVAFTLVSAGRQSVVFASPAHDFPKRVQYSRTGDALRARVDDGTAAGAAEEFTWKRCTPPTDAARSAGIEEPQATAKKN
jgi:hypothetical protein